MNCRICGKETPDVVFGYCPICLKERQVDHKNMYGRMYSDDRYSRLRVQRACEVARANLTQGYYQKVLDLGCYTQEVRNHLTGVYKYTGIDQFEQGHDIINLDLNEVKDLSTYLPCLPNVPNKFDLIFALEIVEHLLYPARLLNACKVLLNPQGVICFSLPNENTLYHRIVMAIGMGCDAQAFKDYKHVHFGTIRQQRAFISEHFKIVGEYSYISTDMHKSRGEWIGKIAKCIPDRFWQFIADACPSLFARGRIYVCKLIPNF